MIMWFQNIVVNGGGDCVEYVMFGMLKGMVYRYIYDVCVCFFKDMYFSYSVWIF